MKHLISNRRLAGPRRGGALLISLVVTMVIAGLASAAFTLGFSQNMEVNALSNQTRALYMAEAGISDGIMQLAGAMNSGGAVPVAIGNQQAPVAQRSGSYWGTLADNGNTTFTLVATGQAGLTSRTLEAVLEPVGGSIYDYAVFAGNRDLDPGYTLGFGGSAGQADDIQGNVFSAGGVSVTGDASVSGAVEASGTIAGAAGSEGVKRKTPDILAMNYAANHDFDVAAMFSSASWLSDDTGGSAWQMPQSSPAHIFRKNPSDRTDETSGTAKDDYFLEDPYEGNRDWTAPNGKRGQRITLSGTAGDPGVSGTDKVYYIDGNLWVHNKPIGRFVFENTDPDGAKVTFVVSGNIYFSDDIFMDDDTKSGVAFIAVKDENEPDSGNIFVGDPRYGTVEFLETYLYAENDFVDNNLSASGSKTVHIKGNMTAGNQVAIERDYDTGTSIEHSKLTVEFDNRISTGALSLPGLPTTDEGVGGYRVLSWREIGN